MSDFLNRKAYRLRVLFLVLFDIIAIQMASFCSLYIRYDFKFDDINLVFINSMISEALFSIVVNCLSEPA